MWVLIVVTSVYSGMSVSQQTYKNERACLEAERVIIEMASNLRMKPQTKCVVDQ